MPIATEALLFAGVVLVLIAAAVAVYGASRHVLHEYFRPLGEYRPFGDTLRP